VFGLFCVTNIFLINTPWTKTKKNDKLSVRQKLILIEKVEPRISVACVCEEYDTKKQNVSDVRKVKDK
jgi:hypothetical protein